MGTSTPGRGVTLTSSKSCLSASLCRNLERKLLIFFLVVVTLVKSGSEDNWVSNSSYLMDRTLGKVK